MFSILLTKILSEIQILVKKTLPLTSTTIPATKITKIKEVPKKYIRAQPEREIRKEGSTGNP